MTSIDLNADLGENVPSRVVADDAAMLRIVTSANVACGFHAGSPEGIRATLVGAVARGVAIGAHPGYDDLEGFGRREVDVDDATLQAQVEYQLGAVGGLATAAGGRVAYVKPHGALYAAVARDERRARVVAAAVRAIDPSLVLLGLAGSRGLDVAEHAGLEVVAEAFADRAYAPDGSLVPRSQPGAVLHDPRVVAARMVRLAREGVVDAIDGSSIAVHARSICVHGDSPGAVAMAEATREALRGADVELARFTA
ncbi:5-oxoprolinase subunit PxpA [Agrococcus versicolor]|uniref:5-oxoprolinase subunit A n=1 Tax=Agrococcus versicolor TaxID=501482 RepID=A0ABP5MFD0_9MICO